MSLITVKNKVKKWMMNNHSNHVDPMTGEINATSLAEEASVVHDIYVDHVDCEIPEDVFAWSFEVAENIKQ